MPQIPHRKIERAVVILPTYNEAATLTGLLNELTSLPLPLDVLVVDDSSPDGTADLVKKHPAYEKRVFLLERPRKLGLATAYKEGFQKGLTLGYDVCLEMDSDLSHDPQDIPRLLAAIEEGAAMAVGSRYLQGISVINWPLRRLIVSIGAGIYTRAISGLPLTDPTSGFKAIRREVIDRLDWDQIKSDGYGFQIEVNYFAFQKGFAIKEIPIIFTERRNGQSKFSFSIILEAAFRMLQLGLMRFLPSSGTMNSHPPVPKEALTYGPPYSNRICEKEREVH
ncbi:MAG: polyprenol monophosphomannose synthase [Nitrospinaceae bacterium]